MHSLLPDYLAKLRFDTQQLATLRTLGEHRGKQKLYVAQSPEVGKRKDLWHFFGPGFV